MMAASKLLQKHLILGHVAYNHRPTMTPFLLSFFKKIKLKFLQNYFTIGT